MTQPSTSVPSINTSQEPNGQSVAWLIEASYSAPLPFRFLCHPSWDIRLVAADGEGCVLHITVRSEGEETGRIRLDVRPRLPARSLESLAREYAEMLRNTGVHLNGAVVAQAVPPPGLQASAIFAPMANYRGRCFDSPVLLLEHADAQVVLSLLGPARKESPEWWAINKRAFEIVRDSLVIDHAARSPSAISMVATQDGERLDRPPFPSLPRAQHRFPDAGSY